ncbi:hypothetical protein HPB47_022185, partial [Ixodes persulcatus]
KALPDRPIAGLHADTKRCRLLAMPKADVTWDCAFSGATSVKRRIKIAGITDSSVRNQEQAEQVKGVQTESSG